MPEMTRCLRGFLGDESSTTKSLKPTVLSWSARHGALSREKHPRRGRRAAQDIREGRFKPDESWSGSWVKAPCPEPLAQDHLR